MDTTTMIFGNARYHNQYGLCCTDANGNFFLDSPARDTAFAREYDVLTRTHYEVGVFEWARGKVRGIVARWTCRSNGYHVNYGRRALVNFSRMTNGSLQLPFCAAPGSASVSAARSMFQREKHPTWN
jgi:hypothetical protein